MSLLIAQDPQSRPGTMIILSNLPRYLLACILASFIRRHPYGPKPDFYRSLFSIHEMKSISLNEFSITYHINPSYTSISEPPVPVTISLIFRPNTRQLADARLTSSHPGVQRIAITELVHSCVPSNNVSLLVRTLLSRARYEIRGEDKMLKV